MKSFKSFLAESETDDCEAWFQKKLFSDDGKPITIDPGSEENTEIENRVIQMLKRFVEGSTMDSNSSGVTIDKLLKCKKHFEKWLTPKSKVMYRGSRSPVKKALDVLRKTTKTTKKVKFKGLGKIEFYEYPGDYKPRSKMQSWTPTAEVAAVFAIGDIYDGSISNPEFDMQFDIKDKIDDLDGTGSANNIDWVPFIYMAKTDNSFFGSKDFGNEVAQQVIETQRDEVYRIGGNIKTKMYAPVDLVDKILDETNKLTIKPKVSRKIKI